MKRQVFRDPAPKIEFHSVARGGEALKNRLLSANFKDLSALDLQYYSDLALMVQNNEIVAGAILQVSRDIPAVELAFIEVAADHRNEKLARPFLTGLIRFAKSLERKEGETVSLTVDCFTPDGHERVSHILESLSKGYAVEFSVQPALPDFS